MTQLKKLQRSAAFAGSLLLATFGTQAAGNFTIQNGTWVVTSEVDGKPGRGMAIDAQDGMLVLAVYNYENSGQPSFHLASGAMTGNHFSGTLTRYKNGRYFGSGPLDAQEDGSVGAVNIDFSSANTGTIQFPGEAAVAISRFNFDGIPAGLPSRQKVIEQWLMAELDADDQPVNALLIQTSTVGLSPGPMYIPQIQTAQSFRDGTASNTLCNYSNTTQTFKCDLQFGGTSGKRTLQWSKHLESMSGTISGVDACPYSPCSPVTRRVVGMRLGMDFSVVKVDAQMDAPSGAMTLPDYKLTPDPGMWVVSNELATGKPGRGMSIDVQYDSSVMLTYNYEKSGAPTFHMGISTAYANNKATAHLIRYEGGRYFGGPALSAREVADAGEVKLEFVTPTLGNIQFPGEAPVVIERFQFGATQPSPQSLFGSWMFFDPEQKQLRFYNVNTVDSAHPDTATGSGSAGFPVRCSYPGGGAIDAVKCTDQNTMSLDNYRFTPVNGRAIGRHDASPRDTTVYVLRVKDRNGRLAGLGKF